MESAKLSIAIAADHRGFALKEQLEAWLVERGYVVRDFGAAALDPTDDYPDFGRPAAEFVAADPISRRGILICGSGEGMAIVANKVMGIRAIVVDRPAELTLDEAPNVLALAADQLSLVDVQPIIEQWLASSEQPIAARHERRIKKINQLD